MATSSRRPVANRRTRVKRVRGCGQSGFRALMADAEELPGAPWGRMGGRAGPCPTALAALAASALILVLKLGGNAAKLPKRRGARHNGGYANPRGRAAEGVAVPPPSQLGWRLAALCVTARYVKLAARPTYPRAPAPLVPAQCRRWRVDSGSTKCAARIRTGGSDGARLATQGA